MIKRKRNPQPKIIRVTKPPSNWIAGFEITSFSMPRKGEWNKKHIIDWESATVGGDKLKITMMIHKEKKNHYIYVIEARLYKSSNGTQIVKELQRGYFDSIYKEYDDPDNPGNDRVWYLVEEFSQKYQNLSTKEVNNLVNELRSYDV